MEKFEIVMAWQRCDSIRKIACDSGLSRNIVTAYVKEFRRSEEAIAPSPKEIDFYLSVEFQRTADNGSSFGFEGKRQQELKPKATGRPKYILGPNHPWRRYVLIAKKG